MIFARTEFRLALCHGCGAETAVVETYVPATRWDPADGEQRPEECPECGEPWGEQTLWREDEPPEPSYPYA